MALSRAAYSRPKVMFIGDSITVGASGGTESTSRGGFRETLIQNLNTRFRRRIQDCGNQTNGVIGQSRICGIAGLRIDELAAAPYVATQLPQFRPDIVFIHAGTNDATQRNSGTWIATLQDSLNNLGTLLNTIRTNSSNCHVFLAKIVPNQTAGANTNIVQFNDSLAALVAARSDAGKITIVDHYSAFTANASWATDYMNDTTHPNAAGNAIMATTWYNAFITVF